MTTIAMNCASFNERLLAYLERETDEPTRLAMDRHAQSCDECGPLLADLRKLRVDAANLPELTPAHDLWSGISQRIETQVVSISGTHKAVARPARRRWMRSVLVAASIVGAAVIGYSFAKRPVIVRSQVAETPRVDTVVTTVAAVPETIPVPSASRVVAESRDTAAPRVTAVMNPAAERAYRTLVTDYDREIAKLRALIEQRRNQMDPMTVAVIEKNMQVIDGAIAECKKAIARDPASHFLMESLNQSLQAKVELMRTAALLPSRT